jgi:hypothetical protein
MSLFRFVKYSSMLFFLGKHKSRLFRVLAVLLFAGVTSLLYGDVEAFLAREHPGTVIYALMAKIFIVYGALLFVLLQFRPAPAAAHGNVKSAPQSHLHDAENGIAADRLAHLSNLDSHDQLQSRSDALHNKG